MNKLCHKILYFWLHKFHTVRLHPLPPSFAKWFKGVGMSNVPKSIKACVRPLIQLTGDERTNKAWHVASTMKRIKVDYNTRFRPGVCILWLQTRKIEEKTKIKLNIMAPDEASSRRNWMVILISCWMMEKCIWMHTFVYYIFILYLKYLYSYMKVFMIFFF